MKIVTFARPGQSPEAGILDGDQVLPLSAEGYDSAIAFIKGGREARTKAESMLQGNAEGFPLDAVKMLAPIPRPPKIICVGLNYRDHAIESNMEIPQVPTIFCKFPTSVIGPGDNVVLPKNSTQPDYEAEFAVVIGQGGRHIKADNWKDHVFGYTNLNDVSARDFQLATTQWIMGKTFDTFCPIGPAIVTADEIADPHALDISMTINGEVLQNSNTKHLIFNIPHLIEHLSSVFTLEPGDIISTGTPSGVGFARKPPRYLKPGDDMVVRVAGLGELRNPVVAEA
jgi:2-keto-4-pentenoate hydratase/2-oxohepta-3-ene-1,7-dioic acid hydratase in catechol pathway